jgi:uncharacterized protein YegJ (DUF2314 family)
MNEAIKTAIKSYDEFIGKFNSRDSNNSDFSVKMKFPYEGGNEHMWVNNIFRTREKLHGVIDSDPVQAISIKAGDTIEIDRDKVSDWMYLRNDTLIGGYTIRVLYNKMSGIEKKQFKRETRFIME